MKKRDSNTFSYFHSLIFCETSMADTTERSYHADPDSRYALPNDECEGRRLDLQYQIVKAVQGGLYPASLNTRISKATRILDIGCGTGLWAAEMAELLPDAEVVGLDISPVRPQAWHPKNVSFLVANAHHKLPFNDGHFDFVNLRVVPDLVLNQKTYPEIIRVLRTGGIFNSVIVTDFWTPDDSFSPAFGRFLSTLKKGLASKQSKLFGDALSLIRETKAFRDFSCEERDVPVGPWMADEESKAVGRLLSQNIVGGAPGYAPIFLSVGLTSQEYEVLVADVEKEVIDPSYHMFWRLQLVYASKL
ncbi:S-adenosyl-L-methionine-dependent methyltransferase [Clavulina sp. PMI_390]|nr:S-adenosyl-L-methionine-dependent methyltransferase [Clavulina sp. PMI_390]